MSIVLRILSGVMLLLSVGALLFAVLVVRRESRIVMRRDLIRLIIALATGFLMTWALEVETPPLLIVAALAAGGTLGFLQGRQLVVRFEGETVYARRSAWGIAAWGGGVVLAQLAGVINRIGVAQLGLAATFLGAASIAGLVIGRSWTINQSRRPAASTAALMLILLLVSTGAADDSIGHDIRGVAEGRVPGLEVTIRGTGTYFGKSVQLDFTNTTDRTIRVRVPAGLKLVPGDSGVQTMITAGGEIIEVPPTTDAPHSDYINAFCGEMHDGIPPSSEVFTPGGFVDDRTMRTVQRIQDRGIYDYDAQEAIWSLTDNNDIAFNELARQLVAPANNISGEDALRLSLAGLAGSALLLANTLVNAGLSVDDVLSAWRSGGGGGLVELIDRAPAQTSSGERSFVYRDPAEAVNDPDRVRSIFELLPPDQTRRDAEAQLLSRLRSEEERRALNEVREAIGPIGPDTDIDRILRDNENVDRVLDALPDEARTTLLDTLNRLLEQERLRNAVDVGIHVLDRERTVELLVDARSDPNQPWRFQDMIDKLDDKTLDEVGSRIEEGATPPTPDQSVQIENLAGEPDLLVALRRNPAVSDYLDSLPPDLRTQVEQQMLQTLERQRLDLALTRVREAIGPIGPDTDLDKVLRGDNVREILDKISNQVTDPNKPTETISIDHHIRTTLEQERLRNAFDVGIHVLDRERTVELLVDARSDPNQPWRFQDMIDKLDDKTLDEVGSRIEEGATPPTPDQSVQIENLAGEPDLLVALRRNPAVSDYLDSLPPDLRTQVEQQMLQTLERQRLDLALTRVREAIGPIGPDTDLDKVLRGDNVREILDKIPNQVTDPNKPTETISIDHHIRTTLEKEQVNNTVEQAHHGIELNRTEVELRRAVEEGRAGDVVKILEGVSPEEADQLCDKVGVPTAARPSSPGLPPTQKPTPPPPAPAAQPPPTPPARPAQSTPPAPPPSGPTATPLPPPE